MMNATQLTSFRPGQPPVEVFSTPSESSTNNRAYECINIGQLAEFDRDVIERFRQYLKTIPFTFTNNNPTTLGRRLRTEADVRMFLDASVILPCWPCELSSNDKGITMRPGAHVAEYRPDAEERNKLLLCEYKGPDVMYSFRAVIDACRNSRAIVQPMPWDIITSQLRKYTVLTGCRHVFCCDGVSAVFFLFPSDLEDGSSDIRFVFGTSDLERSAGQLTLRETFVFAFYMAMFIKGELQDFPQGMSVSVSDGDYMERYPFGGLNPNFAPPEASREGHRWSTQLTDIPPGSHLQLLAAFPTNCPNPRVRFEYLASSAETWDSSYSSELRFRRDLPSFFRGDKRLHEWDVQILSIDDKIVTCQTHTLGIPASEHVGQRPRTPRLPQQFIVKTSHVDSAAFRQEIRAYDILRTLQGKELPYSYGVFTFRGSRVLGIALEQVVGMTLTATLTRSGDSPGPLFLRVWEALKRVHGLGVAHGDIRGDNVLITQNLGVVFVDWENFVQTPENPAAACNRDRINLIGTFVRYGADEDELQRASGAVPQMPRRGPHPPFEYNGRLL